MSSHAASACLPASIVEARVIQVVANFKSVPHSLLDNTDSLFIGDMGLDRLQVRDLVVQLGQEFCVDVPYAEAEGFVSVNSAALFFGKHPQAR